MRRHSHLLHAVQNWLGVHTGFSKQVQGYRAWLDGELQGADRRQHEKLAAEQLLELRANENRLEQALRERQKQIDLANPGEEPAAGLADPAAA